MNFMESGRGFYEEGSKCTLPFSQSSSSSSSSSSRQKAPLPPFSYNHHQRPSWIDNNYEDNNQESHAHHQTELTMDSFRSSGGANDVDDSEHHHQFVIHGGGSNGGGGLGGGESPEVIEREHMFDKIVTPSDVGKLNRLVIPKQQAEKYFPLDASTNEKGLLLNFEDRNGKPWRFRYSYWKSSQSYVMTKGWSRFVKEKKLDAGDVVSFHRGVGEFAKDRLFIDWRRRHPQPPNYPRDLPPPIPAFSSLRPWNQHYQYQYQHYPHLMQANYPVISPHQSHHYSSYSPYHSYGNANVYGPGTGTGTGSVVYLKSTGAIGGAGVGGGGSGGGVGGPQQQVGLMQFQRGGVEGMAIPMTMPIPASMVYESVPVVQGKAAAKKLRLFGVNMECPITENNECEILSSTTLSHFSSMNPSHRPNSSNPSLSLSPYFAHQERLHQENVYDDKGKSSMSLDLDI